jgi:hypothetical protein
MALPFPGSTESPAHRQRKLEALQVWILGVSVCCRVSDTGLGEDLRRREEWLVFIIILFFLQPLFWWPHHPFIDVCFFIFLVIFPKDSIKKVVLSEASNVWKLIPGWGCLGFNLFLSRYDRDETATHYASTLIKPLAWGPGHPALFSDTYYPPHRFYLFKFNAEPWELNQGPLHVLYH